MGRNSFQFKQFTVNQDHCAMKVGTDGVLLGAWASAPERTCRILDIGTGTGLVALMMAQRYPKAFVWGIDIDSEAAKQAKDNVETSPFANRINILKGDATKLVDKIGFDAIVCNPPYFVDSLTSPYNQRTLARHTICLTYESLMQTVNKLLKNDGMFSVIIPMENKELIVSYAALFELYISRICNIKTTPNKPPKRLLIEFKKQYSNVIDFKEEVLDTAQNKRSKWYHELTKEFYIK